MCRVLLIASLLHVDYIFGATACVHNVVAVLRGLVGSGSYENRASPIDPAECFLLDHLGCEACVSSRFL